MRYTQIFDKNNIDYDIIYWNRHNINELVNCNNIYCYNNQFDETIPKIKKIKGYLRFANFAKNILITNKYDRVIIFGTVLGVFLYPFLRYKYDKKYILDIRDYSYENIKAFYYIERCLIRNSLGTIISSEGFKNFLPPHDYILVHNILDWDNFDKFNQAKKVKTKKTINIIYLGFVRFIEQNKKLISKLANDDRFHITYIGKNADKLEEFIAENNISNVTLNSRLLPEETMKHYLKADVINNLYGNNKPELDYALSNKLYHAAQLRIPILVCPNTFMQELSCKYNFGIIMDLDKDHVADELYYEFNNINWKKLYKGCENFLEKVKADNLKFEKSLEQMIKI